MGIQDLYEIISENAPNQLLEYYMHELQGLRIAVDISIFMYKYTRTTASSAWMNQFILLLCVLKKHGIKAVCIFDGPNPPLEKKAEQTRRRVENQKRVAKMNNLIRLRNLLQDEYLPFNRKMEKSLIQEIREALKKKRGGPDTTNYYDAEDIVETLIERIQTLKTQTYAITQEDRDNAVKIVNMMGLASFQADGEAETLCAYLAVKGKVDGVLTEDTDVLPYGTPLMLAFKDFKISEEKLHGIYLPSLLEDLEMNLEEFRDLCVMLGCDYNEHKRAKGFPPDGRNYKKAVPLGAKRALCMIQKYRRIENCLDYIEDIETLKYLRCRELLSIPEKVPEEAELIPFSRTPNYSGLKDLIEKYGLFISIDYIEKCHAPLQIVIDSEDEDDEEKGKEKEENKDSIHVILWSVGLRDREVKKLSAHFCFENSEIYETHLSQKFTALRKPFEEWLLRIKNERWKVNELKECDESDEELLLVREEIPYTVDFLP